MTDHFGLFWGVIASMYIGNLMLLILHVPLVGVFIQTLRVRQGILVAFSLLIVLIAVYSINNSSFDMWVVLAFGVLGWIMSKTGFDPGPLVLAFVLGPILEKSFRQSMLISGGSPDIFLTDPASALIFAMIVLTILFKLIGGPIIKFRKQRQASSASSARPRQKPNPPATAPLIRTSQWIRHQRRPPQTTSSERKARKRRYLPDSSPSRHTRQ